MACGHDASTQPLRDRVEGFDGVLPGRCTGLYSEVIDLGLCHRERLADAGLWTDAADTALETQLAAELAEAEEIARES